MNDRVRVRKTYNDFGICKHIKDKVNVLYSTYFSFELNENYLNFQQRQMKWWHQNVRNDGACRFFLLLLTNFLVVVLNVEIVNIYSFILEPVQAANNCQANFTQFAQWSEMKTLWYGRTRKKILVFAYNYSWGIRCEWANFLNLTLLLLFYTIECILWL